MAYNYSNFGYDGCTCIDAVPERCQCGSVLREGDEEYCEDCLPKIKAERDIETGFLLDELGEYVTNL